MYLRCPLSVGRGMSDVFGMSVGTDPDKIGYYGGIMPTGKVKWFDPKKGFGFIFGEEGQDVFVHYTSIVGSGFRALKDGETVEYEATESGKGFQASRVTRQGGTAKRSSPQSSQQPYTIQGAPPANPQFDGETNEA